tara:strand:- start:151 stop:663 length:513 start_codon:yes stop_codon:yes gene_type:complete
MQVFILERLEIRPVPRNVNAPWLDPKANKIKLTKDFVFRVVDRKRKIDEIIVVPQGYYSDWSSIPRLLWIFYPSNYTEAREGAVAHDYIYSHLHWYFSKKFADELLRAFMQRQGAPEMAQTAFYWSVRVGGGGGWKYRKRKGTHPHWRTQHEKIPYHARGKVPSTTTAHA